MGTIKRDQGNKPKDTKAALSDVNRGLEEQRVIKEAQTSGLSYIDLLRVPINPDIYMLIPTEELLPALVAPFFRTGKKLRLAVADPKKKETLGLIKKLTDQGYKINISLASLSGVMEAIKKQQAKIYEAGPSLASEMEQLDIGTYKEEIASLGKLKEKFQETSSAEALQLLLTGAIRTSASDIHLESKEKAMRVRYRIDGVLHDIFDMQKSVAEQLVSQLKYQAGLKLNVTSIPQDGRFTFKSGERQIDLRVNVMPSSFGESFVLRLLDSHRKLLTLQDLGFSENSFPLVQKALAKPNGMILCTGPTGSGKTTTLYTMLTDVNKPETKIITLEDPVEYRMDGIVQSQMDEAEGYDFASGLRAILRQDPDIIMVGEIRDIETAKIAAQAAMTGHLVFSTLHTNDALSTIPRLVNMGLPAYMIAPALSLVIAQRLVRRICPKCAETYHPAAAVHKVYIDAIANVTKITGRVITPKQELVHGKGCEICSGTGYKGQVGLYEVFLVDKQLADLILQEKTTEELRQHLLTTQGLLTMREDGALKVNQGITTMEEVLRVTAAE